MNLSTDVCVRDYAPSLCMAPHVHTESLMSIVIRGAFHEQLENCERHHSHGHVTFFPAGRRHAQKFGPAGARQIMFRPCKEWLAYLSDRGTDLATAPYATGPEFGLLGHRLVTELENDDALSDLAREGLLLEIVAAFGRGNAWNRTSLAAPRWLRQAREFLKENVCRPVSLAEVARAAGRHETHVAREFRRYFGTSVVGYLRRLRVQRAAELLGGGRAEISAIALDCGYSSHAHLCRDFKRFYGAAPSAWRKARQK